MKDTIAEIALLERATAEICHAESASSVFQSLLEGSRAAAPRAVILLARGGVWKGWGCVGYGADPARRLRSISAPVDRRWIDSLLTENANTTGGKGTREGLGDFGQPPATESSAVGIRIGGRPVAMLVAERTHGESPWHPQGLRILGHAARLRLELDLAWRRLRHTEKRPASPRGDSIRGQTDSPGSARSGPDSDVKAPDVSREQSEHLSGPVLPSPSEATAVEEVAPPDPKTRPLEDARRFARLVATEIRLYNEEDVVLGRRHRDLAQRLAAPLDQGRATFARRFPGLGEDGARLLEDAFVQVLAGGDETLFPRP